MSDTPKIQMIKVSSSAISAYGYDKETGELHVRYASGQSYVYSGVESSTYNKLKEADSLGKFMRDHVMGKHAHKKV